MGEDATDRHISSGESWGPELVQRILGHLAGGDGKIRDEGKGVVFAFPLTGAAAHYEFFRGVKDVLARKAEVVMLTTPSSKSAGLSSERIASELEGQLHSILDVHPHKVLVMDEVGLGNTLNHLTGALERACRQRSISFPEISHDGRLFDDICEHLRALGIQPGVLSRKWWSKGAAGLESDYRAKTPDDRVRFATERRYLYNLGSVYAQAFLDRIA